MILGLELECNRVSNLSGYSCRVESQSVVSTNNDSEGLLSRHSGDGDQSSYDGRETHLEKERFEGVVFRAKFSFVAGTKVLETCSRVVEQDGLGG